MKLLNTVSFKRMESAVFAAEARQRVISNNVANAETPNFKRSEVVFEELVANAMQPGKTKSIAGKRTHALHIPIGSQMNQVPTAQFFTDETTSMNSTTKNNVDLDAEMTLLAKNQLNYSLYVNQINHDIKMMRTAITGQ